MPLLKQIRLLAGITFSITMLGMVAAMADETEWRYGDALFGELKYGPDFEHYEHANPDAPKGGDLKRTAFGGYDSFNPFIVRGRAPVQLNYFGGLLYDTLMEQSRDQAGASYGLVADAFRKADDSSWAVYRIHPDAKWHDGEPIKPEDVIWSMEVLRENYPLWSQYFQNVESAEKTGDREITFRFDQKGNRELPHILGDLVVLPKHWWTGTDANGKQRDISQPTTEPPLGSGPYKIGDFQLGKYITYERVQDYWAKDIPVRKGRYNFDSIRYTYFLNENAMWEAFKKGEIADYWVETDEQRWVNEYTFRGITEGKVEKLVLPIERGQAYQGFFINSRKEKFKDVRVRKALSLLLDFETLNRNLFFGLKTRTDSFFEGGELESQGIPEGRELEILKEYSDQLPEELYTEPFEVPDYSDPSATRQYQRQALKLMQEAGFTFNNRKLVSPQGEPLAIEFISASQESERYINVYMKALRRIGIDTNLRILDTAQFKSRVDSFDFDMVSLRTIQSASPGNEQREYWSSSAADRPGSRNYAGIKDPLIDELVERVILAPDREELLALTHALDRILKWRHYAVPQWHVPEVWFAKWKHIQVPLPQPGYVGIDTLSLWIDHKAAN